MPDILFNSQILSAEKKYLLPVVVGRCVQISKQHSQVDARYLSVLWFCKPDSSKGIKNKPVRVISADIGGQVTGPARPIHRFPER
jgi:hypothetical protein